MISLTTLSLSVLLIDTLGKSKWITFFVELLHKGNNICRGNLDKNFPFALSAKKLDAVIDVTVERVIETYKID